ncbi:MAG: cytochrome c3 family protein [Thermodesulfovibrionia bacterium]
MKGRLRASVMTLTTIIVCLLIPCYIHSVVSAHGDGTKLLKGCGSCHKGHGAAHTPLLPKREEDLCYKCHGSDAEINEAIAEGILSPGARRLYIRAEFGKPFHMPVENTGIHRYDEALPETDPSMPRHAECTDCHNHHIVSTEEPLSRVSGVTIGGVFVYQAQFEYEVCLKCHSESANLPPDERNKIEEFNPSNPSYHPVTAIGKNNFVPSLIPPLTTSSVIKCTDCHNNNDPSGPRGPHGSIYRGLLLRNLSRGENPESESEYALCYGCHSRVSILSDQSFSKHRMHIVDEQASCTICHTPHGSTVYPKLIEFDPLYVQPNQNGQLGYISLGPGAGQCYLRCHNAEHNPKSYP